MSGRNIPYKIVVTQRGCKQVGPYDYISDSHSIIFSTAASIQEIIDAFAKGHLNRQNFDISSLNFSNFKSHTIGENK